MRCVRVLLVCALNLTVVLSLVFSAPQDNKQKRLWKDSSSNQSYEMTNDPLTTLISGKAELVKISKSDPLAENLGQYRAFRYGTLSNGPVNIEVNGREWFLRVFSTEGKAICEKSWDKNNPNGRFSLSLISGEEIRVLIGRRDIAKAGKLSITLLEQNRNQGEQIVTQAVTYANQLLERAEKERKQGRYAEARSKVRRVLKDLENVCGTKQSSSAMDVYLSLSEIAFDLADTSSTHEALKRVKVYLGNRYSRNNPSIQPILMNFGLSLMELGECQKAQKIFKEVLEVLGKTLPEEHCGLLLTKMNLAKAKSELGDLAEANDLLQAVVEGYKKTLPPAHENFQKARMNLALNLAELGECRKALSILNEVLAIREKTLSKNDPYLQKTKINFASVLVRLGRFDEALKVYEESVRYLAKSLPFNHKEMLEAQVGMASIYEYLGQYAKSERLLRQVLKVSEITFPPKHSFLQKVRKSLACFLVEVGELSEAQTLIKQVMRIEDEMKTLESFVHQTSRELYAIIIQAKGQLFEAKEIFEDILSVYEKKLPATHKRLLGIRLNLALTYGSLGKVKVQKSMIAEILKTMEDNLPEENWDYLKAKNNYAIALTCVGDYSGAGEIFEDVIEEYKKIVPPDHPEIQKTKVNFAATLLEYGDYVGAREIICRAVKVLEEKLSSRNPTLQSAWENYAAVLYCLEDYRQAKRIRQKILRSKQKSHPEDHIEIYNSQVNLALACFALGELNQAKKILEGVLSYYNERLPKEHFDVQIVRLNLALVLEELGEFKRSIGLLDKAAKVIEKKYKHEYFLHQKVLGKMGLLLSVLGQRSRAEEVANKALKEMEEVIASLCHLGSAREIETSLGVLYQILSLSLSVPKETHKHKLQIFRTIEGLKGASIRAGRIRNLTASRGGIKIKTLKKELLEVVQKIAEAKDSDLLKAILSKSKVERALAKEVMKLPDNQKPEWSLEPEEIAKEIPKDWFGASFLRYYNWLPKGKNNHNLEGVANYLALVLSEEGILDIVQLGPANPIENAAQLWLEGLSTLERGEGWRSAGERLKDLIWKPIEEKARGKSKVILAPDSALASIPFEALPDGTRFLGERVTISYIDSLSTLTIKVSRPPERGGLVAIGGVSYDRSPKCSAEVIRNFKEGKSASPISKALLGINKVGEREGNLSFLSETEVEVSLIADSYRKTEKGRVIILSGCEASKESLVRLAPCAKFLHIATHGFFAPEKFESSLDLNVNRRLIFDDNYNPEMYGLAPMLLSGLSLAGANLSKTDGILTAEELTGLNMSQCELAVLSACESNVGIIRSGQGILSLQRALSIAGAKRSITTLWKVDDMATALFFNDFYNLLWKNKLRPSKALAEVKLKFINGKSRSTGEKMTDYSHPFYWATFVHWGLPN